jgi:Ca2+-binding EF-hand superfamily protein
LQALRGFYQLHYAELLRHADVAAGELTKSQFVGATRSLTADTSRINAAEAGGHLIFDLIDTNGDGTISQDELTHYLTTVWKIDESEAVYNLEELDTDGDSRISRQEFVRGIQFHLDA